MYKDLHIILKISERCNLACTYCYFFEGGDDSWKKHTPIIKYVTLEKLTAFIAEGEFYDEVHH